MAKLPKLTSNEIEAANRAEVTALLIRNGYRVYRPEADCYGEDLVLRNNEGNLTIVQLKARPTVDWKRYGKRSIWMLFPDPQARSLKSRDWFLVPHDDLYKWLCTAHAHTGSIKKGLWSEKRISGNLGIFLKGYSLSPKTAPST